ncbi:MAG: hypothetical protein GY943_26610 [Chloroflexi bacterium]|nr:hypothetical protein [Chloroflexota bacterium]
MNEIFATDDFLLPDYGGGAIWESDPCRNGGALAGFSTRQGVMIIGRGQYIL